MHMRNMYIIAIIMLLTKATERIVVLLSSKPVAIIVQRFSFVNLFFKKLFCRRRAGAGKRRAMRAKSAAAQGRKRRRILFSAHGMTPLGRETTGKNPPGNPGGEEI